MNMFCKYCGQEISFEAEHLGLAASCPSCNHELILEGISESPPQSTARCSVSLQALARECPEVMQTVAYLCAADGQLSGAEQTWLDEFFGAGTAEHVLELALRLDPAALRGDLTRLATRLTAEQRLMLPEWEATLRELVGADGATEEELDALTWVFEPLRTPPPSSGPTNIPLAKPSRPSTGVPSPLPPLPGAPSTLPPLPGAGPSKLPSLPPALPSPTVATPRHWLDGLITPPSRRIRVKAEKDQFSGAESFSHSRNLKIWSEGGMLTCEQKIELGMGCDSIDAGVVNLYLTFHGLDWSFFRDGQCQVIVDGFQHSMGAIEVLTDTTIIGGGFMADGESGVVELVAYALEVDALLAICNTMTTARFRFTSGRRSSIDLLDGWELVDYIRQFVWAFKT